MQIGINGFKNFIQPESNGWESNPDMVVFKISRNPSRFTMTIQPGFWKMLNHPRVCGADQVHQIRRYMIRLTQCKTHPSLENMTAAHYLCSELDRIFAQIDQMVGTDIVIPESVDQIMTEALIDD